MYVCNIFLLERNLNFLLSKDGLFRTPCLTPQEPLKIMQVPFLRAFPRN